mgnify:CR=1 FL=1
MANLKIPNSHIMARPALAMAQEISEEAMIKATGYGKEHWYPILEELAKNAAERKEITMGLWKGYEKHLSAWWAQMVTVTWERDTKRRVMNQSCYGDFQFSVSKTYPGDEHATWNALSTTDWLDGMVWEEGAEFTTDCGTATVRAVRPGKILRIWWLGHGEGPKSVLEVQLWPKGEKCSLRFQHQKLPEDKYIEPLKARWQDALELIMKNR